MFGFRKKEPEKRLDDVDLRKLQIRMSKLEAEMLDTVLTVDTIRNKVLRKIQTKRTTEEETNELIDESGFLKTN